MVFGVPLYISRTLAYTAEVVAVRGRVRFRFSDCWAVSKLEFKSKLHLPCSRGSIGARYFSGRLAKRAGIGRKISRLVELHTIKKVVHLGPEFQAHPLGNSRSFLKHGIPIIDSRTEEFVATDIATGAKRWI